MGIEKAYSVVTELMNWVHIDNNIENSSRTLLQHVLKFQPYIQKTDQYHMTYQMSCWKLGADIFMLKKETHFSIVDFCGKFTLVKQTERLSVDGIYI